VVKRLKERAFAGVQIRTLVLSGTIGEDDAIETAIRLETLTMDDERQGLTRITRLLDKRRDVQSRSFVDIAYKQNASNDKDGKNSSPINS
jgi:hypothetical protein